MKDHYNVLPDFAERVLSDTNTVPVIHDGHDAILHMAGYKQADHFIIVEISTGPDHAYQVHILPWSIGYAWAYDGARDAMRRKDVIYACPIHKTTLTETTQYA